MRITILDGRHLVGRFMAFDRHMNIVLGDAEEFRRLPPKKGVPEADREIRRPLGLVLIRGEEVVSLTVEGPPPTDDRRGKRDVAPVRDARCRLCHALAVARLLLRGTLGPAKRNARSSTSRATRALHCRRLFDSARPRSLPARTCNCNARLGLGFAPLALTPPPAPSPPQAGPGSGKPAGRGVPAPPPGQVPAGLAGPVRGMGGPGAAAMRPQVRHLCFVQRLRSGANR